MARGYSKAFPAGKDVPSTGYVLQGIPADIWKLARTRAKQEGRTMRSVLLTLIFQWATARPGEDVRFFPAELDEIRKALLHSTTIQQRSGKLQWEFVHRLSAMAKINAALPTKGTK